MGFLGLSVGAKVIELSAVFLGFSFNAWHQPLDLFESSSEGTRVGGGPLASHPLPWAGASGWREGREMESKDRGIWGFL